MESKCHIETKRLLCRGDQGTESRLPSGKRIDCRKQDSKACYEVELNKAKLGTAITRLAEGLKVGQCSKANLITKDRYIPEARKLVGTKSIKVVDLFTMGASIRST